MPNDISPPLLARWLATLAVPAREREFVLGDLQEGFADRCVASRRAARRWYWREAFALLMTRWPHIAPVVPPQPGTSLMASLWNECRFALRALRRAPLYTSLAILTASVGIAASTAIFSVARPIVFQAAPYPSPDKLLFVWEREVNGDASNVGFLTYADLSRDVSSFASTAAMSYWQATLASESAAEQVLGQRVTAGYFSTLGVRPFLGRDFRPEEDTYETRRVIMLTHGIWRRRFGSDSSIAGRTIDVSGYQYLVAGVLPASFENLAAPQAEVFAPLGYDAGRPFACRTCRHLRMIARVKDGVPVEDAARDVERALASVRERFPNEYASVGTLLERVDVNATKGVRAAVYALLGAAGLLLLMSCANVSSLMLGRAIERQTEVAVRSALGARTGRIVRQSAVEAALIWITAALFGVPLARWGGRALVTLSATPLPRSERMIVDASVMATALGIALLCAVVAGVLPAVLSARAGILQRIRVGARALVGGGTQRMRGALIVAEVAVAMVMLSSTGLLVRTVNRLLAVELGFEADRIAAVEVTAVGPRFDSVSTPAYFRRVVEAARAVPGVEHVGLTSQLPLGGDFDGWGVHRRDRPSANPELDPGAQRFGVSSGYFAAMGIPLVAGRLFTAADDVRGPFVVIINKTMAERVFAGESPIGKEVSIGGSDGPWRTIVGVVGDVKHISLDGEQEFQLYHPFDQNDRGDAFMSVVAATTGSPAALSLALQRAVRAIDPGVAVYQPRAMAEVVGAAMSQRRFVLKLLAVFAAVAVVLVTAGLYGAAASGVAERRREIGLRAALGATRSRIISTVLSRSARLVGAGVGLGLVGAFVLNRALRSLLFGVSPGDPLTMVAMTGVLLFVAAVAAAIPAGRAVAVDPATTLRDE
jgi:putative ABC transport system permease protein